jgi:hypothetical protein
METHCRRFHTWNLDLSPSKNILFLFFKEKYLVQHITQFFCVKYFSKKIDLYPRIQRQRILAVNWPQVKASLPKRTRPGTSHVTSRNYEDLQRSRLWFNFESCVVDLVSDMQSQWSNSYVEQWSESSKIGVKYNTYKVELDFPIIQYWHYTWYNSREHGNGNYTQPFKYNRRMP